MKLLIWIAFSLILIPKSALACPLCKEAVAKMGEIWTSLGFNWSILFMLTIPFLLVGTFVFVLYRNYKKYEKSRA